MLLTTYPLLVPRSWKSRAIPLPILWATTGSIKETLYHILGHFLSASLPYELFTLRAGTTRTMSHKLLLSGIVYSESTVARGILMKNLAFIECATNRSQLPRGLRRGSATARFLGLQVRILPGTWLSVVCEYCVLSGGGFCDGPITSPEEFNQA